MGNTEELERDDNWTLRKNVCFCPSFPLPPPPVLLSFLMSYFLFSFPPSLVSFNPHFPLSFSRLSVLCLPGFRPFIRQGDEEEEEEEDEGLFEVGVRPKKSVGTPGGQIGGVVLRWHKHTHSNTHTHTHTHTLPSSHQSVMTTGLGKTKYRLPSTPLTDRLPLHTHTHTHTHTQTNHK